MADELEVLEKQQLSVQRSLHDLTDQLTLADHLVYKKYLTELQNYGMVELSQKMLEVQDSTQCIRMFQLKRRGYVPKALHGVLFQHGTRL